MDENISIESFLVEAPEKLEWLEERCFHRSKKLEQSSSTLATLVYRGEHVAFEFSLDVRDQCIDTEVIKVENGKLLRNWDGGYSSDVFSHLVKKERYRGKPSGECDLSVLGSELEKAICGWSSLLETAGQKLLADNADSLG
jgi:hypothetical protein